ncbi:uncharacterized protein LOC125060524 [Pieris napi]|uniref:uncharacterized protein LOC125060524 n=1 Tax=Pieris napi TaxID=78633 RepID=UPI001FB8DCAA|nr:uncharacterized protein LOC125060524 [Pieris napi]
MSSDRDFVIQFIYKFRDLTCLWDVTDINYRNKRKRDAALEVLLTFYKTKLPNATIDTVKKKLQALRASFRKEFNKVKASMQLGAGTDDIHVPKLWYYDQLIFLKHTETPRAASSIHSILVDPFEDTEEIHFESDLSENSFDASMNLDPLSPWPCSTLSASSTSTSYKRTKNQADAVLNKIAQKLDEPRQPPIQPQKYESFGQHVAEKMRSLPPNVAIHCEKIINDALYYGALRNLNVTSRIVTDPVPITILPGPQKDSQHTDSFADLTE